MWLEEELKRNFKESEYFFDKADKAPYKFEKADIMINYNKNPLKKENFLLIMHFAPIAQLVRAPRL